MQAGTASGDRNETVEAIQVDTSDPGTDPIVYINDSDAAADNLHLNLNASELLAKHEKIGISLTGVCSDVVPDVIDDFNGDDFQGIIIIKERKWKNNSEDEFRSEYNRIDRHQYFINSNEFDGISGNPAQRHDGW